MSMLLSALLMPAERASRHSQRATEHKSRARQLFSPSSDADRTNRHDPQDASRDSPTRSQKSLNASGASTHASFCAVSDANDTATKRSAMSPTPCPRSDMTVARIIACALALYEPYDHAAC
eukprot:1000214-Rhodomonas_salina.4